MYAGCAADENGQLAETETAIDRFIVAWNAEDADAVVSAFAPVFGFKGLGPYEPERTDAASMESYLEALAPLDGRIERMTDVIEDESGVTMVEVLIRSTEIERVAQMELDVEGGILTRLVTLSWEKPDTDS